MEPDNISRLKQRIGQHRDFKRPECHANKRRCEIGEYGINIISSDESVFRHIDNISSRARDRRCDSRTVRIVLSDSYAGDSYIIDHCSYINQASKLMHRTQVRIIPTISFNICPDRG